MTAADLDAEAVLATILLLDAFPRQIGHEPDHAARDKALALATRLVASGRDKNLSPLQRGFAFLPFMHSEALIDRERAVALFAGLRREAQDLIFEQAYDEAVRRRDALMCPPTGGRDS
jgi:uncharacterized protein (DUF924 family)